MIEFYLAEFLFRISYKNKKIGIEKWKFYQAVFFSSIQWGN